MKILFPAFAALLMISCSPVAYNLAVDVKKPAEFSIDLKGCPPSIVCICARNGLDSALTSNMSLGIAECIEKELSLENGAIPVFSYFSDEMEVSNPDDVAFLLTTGGSDRVIVMDSLEISDFQISHTGNKVIYGTELMNETIVKRPFRIGFKVFCLDSLNYGTKPLESSSVVSDVLQWSLFSSGDVDDSKAMSKAVSASPKVFHDMGQEIGSMFFPQWEEQNRVLISYENDSNWTRAYSYAKNFRWEEAMKIWMTLASSSNPQKASYASYNIAVACELQEQYDLAVEWLNLAKSKYYFYEISQERAHIDTAIKNKKKKK